MKYLKILLVGFTLFSITACAQAAPDPTSTFPPKVTSTPAPTQTSEPSPTATPLPYLFEGGVLQDWDAEAGDYKIVAENIGSLANEAGVIFAFDETGFPRYFFSEDSWVEILKPEGTELLEEYSVPDRYVSVVNEEGKVEEVLESGVKVLVNPKTGKYENEFKDGQWVAYTPRVMVVGTYLTEYYVFSEVPADVVENSIEIVRNAPLFIREKTGEEIITGYDEVLGEYDKSGKSYMWWNGVFCGSSESFITVNDELMVSAFIGVELKSKDVMVVTVNFTRTQYTWAYSGIVFLDGVVPGNTQDLNRVYKYYDLGEDIVDEVAGEKVVGDYILESTPLGTVFYISSILIPESPYIEGISNIYEALKSRELFFNGAPAGFGAGSDGNYWGASEKFWDGALNIIE